MMTYTSIMLIDDDTYGASVLDAFEKLACFRMRLQPRVSAGMRELASPGTQPKKSVLN